MRHRRYQVSGGRNPDTFWGHARTTPEDGSRPGGRRRRRERRRRPAGAAAARPPDRYGPRDTPGWSRPWQYAVPAGAPLARRTDQFRAAEGRERSVGTP